MMRSLAASWWPLLAAHVWNSTLFLLLVLFVIAVLRTRLTAGARFALALIGVAKFAIPSAAFSGLFPAKPIAIAMPWQAIGGTLQLPVTRVVPALWPAVLIGLWLTVAVALILRTAITRHRLVVLAVRTAVPADEREIRALTRAARRVGIRRSVDIARSALPEAPAVLRVLRPLIVLPPHGCGDLADDELESLLTHEIAHVARHDNLTARIESFICALFWFHPLIWIAQRVSAVERERACDEVVARTADERETYLTALTKFCHAAIAPRLPGVSCMATARLKERIDHIMRFPTLERHAPSVARVTLAATAALILFTAVSAFTGSGRAFARPAQEHSKPYSLRLQATKSDDAVVLHVTITDNATHDVLATPSIKIDATRSSNTRTTVDGYDIEMDAQPAGEATNLTVTISKDGDVIQKATLRAVLNAAEPSRVYTGAPISMELHDADLRDVLNTFGKLTGLQMDIDPDVQGKVTVSWHNVPWDEAFDTLTSEHGLTWTVRDGVARISRK